MSHPVDTDALRHGSRDARPGADVSTEDELHCKIRALETIAEHNRRRARTFYECVCAALRLNPDRYDPNHLDLFARLHRAKPGHELTNLIATVRDVVRTSLDPAIDELRDRLAEWDQVELGTPVTG